MLETGCPFWSPAQTLPLPQSLLVLAAAIRWTISECVHEQETLLRPLGWKLDQCLPCLIWIPKVAAQISPTHWQWRKSYGGRN